MVIYVQPSLMVIYFQPSAQLCDIYGLTNLIKEPTCHKGKVSTLIDVLLVSNPRRFCSAVNTEFCLSDFHNIIGAATRRFVPVRKPYPIQYRSFKNFDDAVYVNDIAAAPFHVDEIFDDVNDTAWFTSTLISDITETHAPTKTKWVKCKSAPFMNSNLRKAIHSRNMARNKFRKYGKLHWEKYRQTRNKTVSIRKKSLENYFRKNCEKMIRTFGKLFLPFLKKIDQNPAERFS